MRREATTTTQPSRPRTGHRAGDEVVGSTGLLQVQPMAIAVSQAFQAASHLNKASITPRRQERARPPRSAGDTRKGTKYQWLRSYADPGVQKAQDFHRPHQQEPQKARASAIKENFRRIWSYRSVTGAMRFANDWTGAVANAGIRSMMMKAEIVKRHPRGIAGFVTHPITNAAGEGAHSMKQSLRHRARGLPNSASPRTRVLLHPGGFQLKPS